MRTDKFRLALMGTMICAVAACGTNRPVTSTASSIPVTTTTTTAANASGYGVVQSVELVQRDQAGIGLGTVAGAVVGGVLGNQVGSGRGQTAATVGGAAGGAYIGNQMEKNARGADQVYRVAVRMDNGTVQSLVHETNPGLQIGERVRVDSGMIVERIR